VWSVAGLWLLAAVVTIERTLPHWRNDLTLWTWGGKRAPGSATPPANLARYYAHERDYEPCLASARRAVQLDPSAHAAWNLAGHALMALGRYAEAQVDFEQAVRLAPQSGLYWNNVAGAMMEQKQYEAAERMLLERALPRDPMEPATRTNLGIVYLLTERPALAVPHLREAVRLVTPGERAEVQAMLDHALSGRGPGDVQSP
jgi:Flp pilus assembly protein TadD